MYCHELVELITDYMEGKLDEPTRVELEAHIALCDGCAQYLRNMRVTIQTLGHMPFDSLSGSAKAKLLRAFRDYPRSARRS